MKVGDRVFTLGSYAFGGGSYVLTYRVISFDNETVAACSGDEIRFFRFGQENFFTDRIEANAELVRIVRER